MSSAGSGTAATLTSIQQNDYMTLAILTAYGYDYVLTISDEIEYIWSKPWSWVSTLFVLVRYFGLLTFIAPALLGSTFLPGPLEVYVSILHLSERQVQSQTALVPQLILFIVHAWAYPIFLGASDLVMILRVWAVYNRSKAIIGTLLTLYLLAIIPSFAVSIIYCYPKNLGEAMVRMLKISLCIVSGAGKIPILSTIVTVLQVLLVAVMCGLIVVQFLVQSLQMYKATGRWKLNRYMNLLVREGIIYFVVVLALNIVMLLVGLGDSFSPAGYLTLAVLEYIPVCMVTPRFILSVRRLHARDLQERRIMGVDTGFGLSALALDGTSRMSSTFVNSGGEDEGEVEEIILVEGPRVEHNTSGV